ADRPAHHKPRPGRGVLGGGGGDELVPGEQLPPWAAAAAAGRGVITPPPRPGVRGNRTCPPRDPASAGAPPVLASPPPPAPARPAARTGRPARRLMPSRKLSVVARRRLFGWNVRLVTGDSRHGVFIARPPPARARVRARLNRPGVTGSVHGTRRGHHWSNQAA